MTPEQIEKVWESIPWQKIAPRIHENPEEFNKKLRLAFARALLSESKPADQFPAQPPAQYQMRVILEDGTPWGDWVNVSPEGARTLREKYYAANYEVRELFDRAASPPAPAQSGALNAHERNALNEAVKQLPSISALRTLRDRLLVAPQPAQTGDYIDVVFDGPPSHESGRFVECEDPDGKSVNAGEWIDRGNGLWALRIKK
jgi:hypothetical protein